MFLSMALDSPLNGFYQEAHFVGALTQILNGAYRLALIIFTHMTKKNISQPSTLLIGTHLILFASMAFIEMIAPSTP